MLRKITAYVGRHHIALLALFFALGGTAFAAGNALLPKNSVGTAQLKAGAVTKGKIASKTLRQLKGNKGAQGAPGAAGPQGPAGPQGVAGPQGPAGPAGAAATKYFAHIGYSGTTPTVTFGTPGITVSPIATGATDVKFPVNVSACVTQLTLFDSGADGSVRKGTGSSGPDVLVGVRSLANTAQNWGYDIAEFC